MIPFYSRLPELAPRETRGVIILPDQLKVPAALVRLIRQIDPAVRIIGISAAGDLGMLDKIEALKLAAFLPQTVCHGSAAPASAKGPAEPARGAPS
jgi:hypothetical protein